VLELDDLTRRFGPVVALDHLSLQVAPGELIGLLGPNGAGKSTAIRIVFGLLRAHAGEVRWEGRQVGQADRRRFGYLPEERGLYPKMEVREQLVYLARLHGLDRAAASAATDGWLDNIGLSDRGGDKVEQLSLGNQQRVQLAAALVHDPVLAIMDEPFSGLDPVAVDVLSATLAERAASGAAVVFSSHQLDLVESLCHSVVVIDHGRLVMSGPVRQLKEGSGRRRLRVRVEPDARAGSDGTAGGDGPGWAERLDGVTVTGHGDAGTTMTLRPEVDPLAVLDVARAAGTVSDFGLELPSLSELFREAVSR